MVNSVRPPFALKRAAVRARQAVPSLPDESGVGFALKPKLGSALMFDSMRRGTSNPVKTTWHAGCNVVKGTKIILQKFKELPRVTGEWVLDTASSSPRWQPLGDKDEL